MVESRWLRWIGPGVVAIGAVGLVASATAGAAVRPWAPRACAGPPGAIAAAAGDARPADLGDLASVPWFRQDPVVDGGGDLRGQRVAIGLDGDRLVRSMDLPAELFAAGPFGRIVLVGSDDGTASRLVAVDVAGGCSWPIAEERDVIRRATVDPTGTSIIEMRVDRVSRADHGIWLRPIDGRARSSPDPRSHRRRRSLRPHLVDRVHVVAGGRPARHPVVRGGRLPDADRASGRRRPSGAMRRCSTRRTSVSWSAWTATTS